MGTIIGNGKKHKNAKTTVNRPLQSPTKLLQRCSYKCRGRETNVQKPPSNFANTNPRMPRFIVAAKLADSNPRHGEAALRRVGGFAEAVAFGFSSYALCLHLDRLLHQSRFRFLRSPPRRCGEDPQGCPLWFADRGWSKPT